MVDENGVEALQGSYLKREIEITREAQPKPRTDHRSHNDLIFSINWFKIWIFFFFSGGIVSHLFKTSLASYITPLN